MSVRFRGRMLTRTSKQQLEKYYKCQRQYMKRSQSVLHHIPQIALEAQGF